MTWLDDAIGWFSPRAGLERARARAALRMVRAFEGASTGRRTSNWKTTNASANAEISGGISRLRSRSRDLIRNNPYATSAIDKLVGNAVGTGISLGCESEQLLKLWNLWVKEADFYGDSDLYGLQALASRSAFESGDCLLVRRRTRAADAGASGVPLRIQVLEGDHLDPGVTGAQANGNFAIGGIEVDRDGRRVAYHLFDTHPGEAAIADPRMKSRRVLAEDVIYLFEKKRPGQLLGFPRLAVSIMRLRDLDEYQEALLVKKKIEACFAAFVQSDDTGKLVGTTSNTETDADGNSRRIERLSPGMVNYLRTGETVTFGEPSSSADGGFTSDTLHAIAAGAGCTYEQLTGDLSGVNYSSMRGGRAEFKILIEQYRWLTFVPQVLERIYTWWEEAAYGRGKLRTTGYEHVWTPPRWEYVNPKEDVEADRLELDAGLATLSDKLRGRGENPAQVFKEIAQEREQLDELGVKVNFGRGQTAAAAPAKDPADPEDPADPADLADPADAEDPPAGDAERLIELARALPAPQSHLHLPTELRHAIEQNVVVTAPGIDALSDVVQAGARANQAALAQMTSEIVGRLGKLGELVTADRVLHDPETGETLRSVLDIPKKD